MLNYRQPEKVAYFYGDLKMNDLVMAVLCFLCFLGLFLLSHIDSEKIAKLEQENQSLKEIKGLTSNPKFITPQPNEPIEIGKVGNRTFFLAKLDDKECISVIGLNMGSYFICGDEPKLDK